MVYYRLWHLIRKRVFSLFGVLIRQVEPEAKPDVVSIRPNDKHGVLQWIISCQWIPVIENLISFLWTHHMFR